MRNTILTILVLIASLTISKAQTKLEEVKIGNQIWTSNNLDVFGFNNGDAIPQATSADEWSRAANNGTPAWCYYNFDASNREKYGKLYNWHAVMDERGLAPEGWHIPSFEEWQTLVKSVGGELAKSSWADNKEAAKKLKSTSGWFDVYTEKYRNGSNESGFNATAGGLAINSGSKVRFINLNNNGFFWTSSTFSSVLSRIVRIDAQHSLSGISGDKGNGLSVRLVKD